MELDININAGLDSPSWTTKAKRRPLPGRSSIESSDSSISNPSLFDLHTLGSSNTLPNLISSRPGSSPSAGSFSFSSTTGRQLKAVLPGKLESLESNISLPNEDVVTDVELVTAMAARLAQLETALRDSRALMKIRDMDIGQLSRQIESLKNVKNHDDLVRSLEDKADALQEKLERMEAFLKKYDMIWDDGNFPDSDSDEGDENFQAQPMVFPYDIIALKRRISELNEIAGDGTAEIIQLDGLKTLRLKQALSIKIFQNGLVLNQGPFRAFSVKASKLFMRDMVDGYFPYELKDKHPDGVPFELIDLHTQQYVSVQDKYSIFGGQGYTLNDVERPKLWRPPVMHSQENLLDTESGSYPISTQQQQNSELKLETKSKRTDPPTIHTKTSQSEIHQETREGFIAKLPKTLIHNGNIVEVRDSIKELLQTSCTSQPFEKHIIPVIHDSTLPTTRLKVTTDVAELDVLMNQLQTIQQLYDAIAPHATEGFEIRSRMIQVGESYHRHWTLKDAGLTPSARLYLKNN